MIGEQAGRRTVLKGLAATAAASIAMPYVARAANKKLVVGKSVSTLLAYTPIDIGLANNLYRKRGLDLEVTAFEGSARLHQAMVAGSIDIALGSGATMSDVGKGEPSLCIAETLGPPADIAIIVPWNSPIKTPDDMRGKLTGVATTGSVTEWVLFELARQKGWPLSDMKTVGLGGIQASIAALRTGEVEAIVSDVAAGFFLEPQKAARVLVPCSAYIKDCVMHANYASTKAIAEQPDAVTAFCAGWFEAVALMQRDKEQTVRVGTPIMGFDADIVAKTYDIVIPQMSKTGRFTPEGLATLARSYVVMKKFPTEPDMAKFYTEKFLPKA
ncbi:MAG TPA: ABC transporter substrate-binding protein [Stellaceae bacterium]|nr:ABC transporter substrate-binding protein [Stellaceae bacterium]